MRPLIALLALTLLLCTHARAETVPTPSDVLGFELGSRPAHHGDIERYAEALAAASPRVELERYAKSHEGRDLLAIVISSENNLARLDDIRRDIARIADPRPEMSDEELERLVRETPAIAYLAYAIHGDEESSADAALRVAYELATGTSDDMRLLRDQLVVVVDPLENPDGRERVLAMHESFSGAVPNPDPDALSHTGVWPWGRTNHYLFDLNRDWFALVHPESRGRAGILRTWRPQLVVDSHEMGAESTYLFSPPRRPFNPHLPSTTQPWWERFAADQARAFDQHGWSYYTREWNEEFFPGYGSALSLYQGAVGILYEQAGTAGQPVRKQHGGILRYEDAVAHHVTSSFANLGTAARNRQELLRAYRQARAEAVARGRQEPARAFYFTPSPDPQRAARLCNNLRALGIEVDSNPAPLELAGAHSLRADGDRTVTLPARSYRVRLDQPDGLLALVLLAPHVPMTDSFLAEQREHLERQKGSRLYDVTAWSSLLASNLDSFWTAKAPSDGWEPVGTADVAPGLLHPPADLPTYGWIFDGGTDGAVALAARLATRGLKVRMGDLAFAVDDRDYARGSFLLRREENPADVANHLSELAPAAGVEVWPTATARVASGHDLGGDHYYLLSEARIAIAAGNPIDTGSLGAAWHLLDRELGMRVSLVDVTRLGDTDLARYNVLVLPDVWGGGSAYERVLGESGIKTIGDWVEQGGTLVALAEGAYFAASDASKLSSARPRQKLLKEFPPPELGLASDAILSLERLQATGLRSDGAAVDYAGPYSEEGWPAALSIPGVGSPVLGAGTWALLGDAGKAARKRGSLHSAPDAKDSEGKEPKEKPEPATDEEKEKAREKADARLRRFLPSGAILRVELDPEHWLASGAGTEVAVMARSSDALLARDPARTVARFAAPADLHLGGLLWPEAAGRIAHTAFITCEGKGRGQIILFADDPNFRGYFWGSERLFLNAVLLGPGLGTAERVPW